MIHSMKASHPLANETRIGCRKRDQITGEGEGLSESKARLLKYGYVSILGRRRVMEDPVMVMPPRRLPGGYFFFAAYGSFGGAKVAETCTKKLHQCLEKHTEEAVAEEGLGWGNVVMDCFSSVYEDWSGQEAAAAPEMLKFTAVVVAVEKGEVVVVNCGGSRAVLWSGGVALPLWSEHSKRDEADESVEELTSTSTSQVFPEVRVMRRNEGDSDDFLIIASDGLWKVVGKEMACEVVRKCVGGKIRRLPSEEAGDSVSQATAMLAELAIAKGIKDKHLHRCSAAQLINLIITNE